MRRVRVAGLVLAVSLSPSILRAQAPIRRPKLHSMADTNDEEAYFDDGVSMLSRGAPRSREAFWWAERLAPARAEPIYGQWIEAWMLDIVSLHEPKGMLEYAPGLLLPAGVAGAGAP